VLDGEESVLLDCRMCLCKQRKRVILLVFTLNSDYSITFPVRFSLLYKRIYSPQVCSLYQHDFTGPKIRERNFFLKTKHRASVTSACDHRMTVFYINFFTLRHFMKNFFVKHISQFSVNLSGLLRKVLQNAGLNLNYRQTPSLKLYVKSDIVTF
jgi:hypothetical protein